MVLKWRRMQSAILICKASKDSGEKTKGLIL